MNEAATYLGGAARTQILREAALAYQAALAGIDRQKAVQEWSIVSYNLGSAQLQLGETLTGDEAAEAFREAVATLEKVPALLPAGALDPAGGGALHQADALLELGLGMLADEGRLRIEKALKLYGDASAALPRRSAGGAARR